MPLPLILAGPILRRIEPRLVTVWIALRENALVTLSLWDNIANDGSDDGLFSGPAPKFVSPAIPTVRTSANLHICVVTLAIAEPGLLLPAHIYSYNVTLSTATATHDLKSQGLLRDNMFDNTGAAVSEGGHLHAALGYGKGDLPSFAMPPPELTDLRLLHYSCRRPHERGADALHFVDTLVGENLRDGSGRPHMLLMTGDQIYADDVAMPLLPILSTLGQELLGPVKEKITGEAGPLEINQENFPAGFRGKFLQAKAGFTTGSTSHLTSFGEYAAMYLAVWNNLFWPLPERDGSFPEFKFSLFEDLLARINPKTDELISTWEELFRVPEKIGLAAGELERFLFHFFVTLPRDTLLKFFDKDEEVKFDPRTLKKALLPAVSGEVRKTYELTYNFAAALSDEGLLKFKPFVEWLQGQFLGKQRASTEQLSHIKLLYNTLPQVRRAMANVPCYMMWDDHDVTDDWYITGAWRDQVLTKDAGVTVLRNGMVAGAMFQLWGNDPKAFEPVAGDPNHPNSKRSQFLVEVQGLYPDAATEVSQGAIDAVNTLLGLDGAEPPPLLWHFSLDGPRYRLLALDTRTRRRFPSRFSPPGMLTDAAIEEQIPQGPLPSGLNVLLVLSPVPVLGPPIDEEIARPLGVRVTDMFAALENQPPEGQIKMDMEWWSANPETFEKLLARLESYKKVVFLSGDVHHGLGGELDYWKNGEPDPAHFVQFTSSPAKNILPMEQAVPIAGSFAFSQRIIRLGAPIERLSWLLSDPEPVNVPGGQLPSPRLRALLRREPVMIPVYPWPDGTSEARPADWRWRFKQLCDERPDAERPAAVRPLELPADFDALASLEQYKLLMERHLDYVKKNDFGRVFVFTNHIGLVRFSGVAGSLEARHEIHTIHPDQPPTGKPLAFTIHKASLEPTSDAPPSLGLGLG